MRSVIWTVSALLAVAVSLAVLGWVFLFVPYFSDARTEFVSKILSEQLGQPVIVEDDVSIVVGMTSQFVARGVRIPSESMRDVQLAELRELAFKANTLDALKGQINLDNVVVRGLDVNLIKTSDGTTSWSEQDATMITPKSASPKESGDGGGILSFLNSREVFFEDIQLVVSNEDIGFEFDFNLAEYTIEQATDETAFSLASSGTVNSEPFTIDGYFPYGAPFAINARMGSISLSYDGVPFSDDGEPGYAAQLKIEVAQLADLLDVLKLNGSLAGSGTLDVSINKTSDLVLVESLNTNVELDGGETFSLNGTVGDLLNLDGFDLQFVAQLFAQDDMPEPARELADLKVTSISTLIASEGDSLDFDDVSITTNSFQREFQEIGPIEIKRIHRTEEGRLAIESISIQAGAPDAPFIAVQGSILDLLQLEQLDFSGSLSVPASLVLEEMEEDIVAKLGGIDAEFAIDDSQGALSLRQLSARSVDTEIWDMSANFAVEDVINLDGLDLGLELGIEDVATFLNAFDITPVNAGRFRIRTTLNSSGPLVDGDLYVAAGKSEAKADYALDLSRERWKVTTELVSDTLSETDVRNALATYEALSKLVTEGANPTQASTETVPLQPLVLPTDVGLGELVSVERAIAQTDIYGRAELKKIIGVEGLSKLSSDLSFVNGLAKLGPVNVALRGGLLRFEAQMDTIKSPETVSVSGSTTGWYLADITQELGIDLDADGVLSGSFSVAGNRTSVQTFVNSMVGWARLEMSSGRIATSLLELAGLGLFPWVFSKELQQGFTTVNCIAAPVKIRAGEVSFDQVVAETNRVQVFVRGLLDWNADRINLRAEPRPIGQPLEWSAVPVHVTGRLSQPDFKLKLAGSKSRRADGATQLPENRKPCVPDIYQLQ